MNLNRLRFRFILNRETFLKKKLRKMNRNFAGNSRKIIAFLWILFSSFFLNHNLYLKCLIRWEGFYCIYFSCWESFLPVAVASVSTLRNKRRAFWIFVWSTFGCHIVWEKPLWKSSLCFVLDEERAFPNCLTKQLHCFLWDLWVTSQKTSAHT